MSQIDPYAELDWRADAFEQANGKRRFPVDRPRDERSSLSAAANRRG